MDTLLNEYALANCMTDRLFDAVFMHDDRHCLQHVFKLFEMCSNNAFKSPWVGQWITARQAHRLLVKMYGADTSDVTPVTISILQFVLDWWNIRHVFGNGHAFNELCGYPCLSPRQVPPLVGPKRRLTASDFAMVWCR